MKKNFQWLVILVSFGLMGCSVNPLTGRSYSGNASDDAYGNWQQKNAGVMSDGPIAKNAEKFMDSLDKSKMLRALDKPLGKSTEWENVSTGYTYTVTPVSKLKLNDNPFCRTYTIVATKGEKTQEINGTACVGDDANWHPVS